MGQELEKHLRRRIKELRELRSATTVAYGNFKDRIDQATERLLQHAKVWDQYQGLQNQLKQEHKRLQRQADMLSARMAEIEEVLQWQHGAPEEEDGYSDPMIVALDDLDQLTADMLLAGNEDTMEYFRETNTVVVDGDGVPVDEWWINEEDPPSPPEEDDRSA